MPELQRRNNNLACMHQGQIELHAVSAPRRTVAESGGQRLGSLLALLTSDPLPLIESGLFALSLY